LMHSVVAATAAAAVSMRSGRYLASMLVVVEEAIVAVTLAA